MMKRTNTIKQVLLCFIFSVSTILFSQTCGPYTGVTHLSNITGPCSAAACALLSDTNFTSNGCYEIAYGSTFQGTWASGLGYTDIAGPEILCISLHTLEGWDVALVLSDNSITSAIPVTMDTILDYVTWDLFDCPSAAINPGWYYDRRIAWVDFSSFTIPAGLTVIGATFTLTVDNAGAPDPVGMILFAGNSTSPVVSNNGPICLGDTLQLFASGADSSTYSWIGPASFNSVLQNPIIVNATSLNAGLYTCYITDSLSNNDTAYTTVIINPNPTAAFVLPSLCEQSLGNFSITAANDTMSNYHWDFGTAASNDTSNLAAPQFSYNGGNYNISLVLTSDEGCTDTLDTNVVVHLKPLATMASSIVCVDESETFDPTITADTTVNYSWTFPTGVPSTSTDSVPTINFPVAGNPNIGLILTTDFGCADTFNFPFIVNGGANPTFGIYPICISRFTFDPLPSPSDSAWVINWDMGDGTQYNNMDTSYFNHNYQDAGNYNVQMSITDGFGCVDTVTLPVQVLDTISIKMPNVLVHSSTQGNNKVDLQVYKPGFNLCVSYTYTIYDRWGTLVFETTNDPYNPDMYCGDCFQGKTQNGNQLTAGVYYYIMKGNFNIVDSGFITIFD